MPGAEYHEYRILAISFRLKLTFILLELALAIAFLVCSFKGKYNEAGVLEWALAFIFTFYILSFFVDLLPAVWARDGTPEMRMVVETNVNDVRVGRETRDVIPPAYQTDGIERGGEWGETVRALLGLGSV